MSSPKSAHDCPPGHHFRGPYAHSRTGKIVKGSCVKSRVSKKSPKKSPIRSPSKCLPGQHFRKGYVTKTGKKVKGSCVKSRVSKKSPKKSVKKSPKKSKKSPKKSSKKSVKKSPKKSAKRLLVGSVQTADDKRSPNTIMYSAKYKNYKKSPKRTPPKCPPGQHWRSGYITKAGRGIKGSCVKSIVSKK